MATTAREGTIPAARGNEKRGRVVWIPSSISTHHMINKTPSSSLPPTTTHHIKKTPTKSSSGSTTQRSTITTSVPPTSDKPIPNALRRPIRTSRLDPSKKETRDKTSTSRSNTHGSSSALQKPSLNGRRLFDKPPPSARLLKHSIRGGINATSNKLTVRYSPSFTSKTGSVSASSSSRFSARPAPVDRRKNVPSPPSSVLKPRTRSSGVSKSGSTHLSSVSKKDATAGGTMNCWKKKKNGPKNGTSESNIEVERQNDHKYELGGGGGHHLVTEVNDDEGSADNNNNNNNVDHDHDEQVESLPDMSEMPCVNKEHLGDPNLTDLHEEEIIKTSDHHHDHISVGDNDDENLLQPTSQDEDELVGNDRKTCDPEEEAAAAAAAAEVSTVITKEGAINTSDVDNEGQDRLRKTVDHDQHTEAMPEQGEAADQKNNMEAEDEERSKSETVGSELDEEEVVSEEADNKDEEGARDGGGEKTDDDAVVVEQEIKAAGEETKKMTNNSNNNHKREGEVGSAGGGSNIMKTKKKDRQEVYNDVIEETSKKLMDQNKKNKVKALAGAFETVISLQDNNSKASN